MVHLSLEGSENIDNGARRILLCCQRKAPLHVGAYIIIMHEVGEVDGEAGLVERTWECT